MILAYETATDICSVAFEDADGNVYEKRSEDRGVHSEKLFVFTQELMREHTFGIGDIDTFLISNGPGSYTGLRIAASGIKGLLYGKDKDIWAVNTLAGIAMGVQERMTAHSAKVHSILNARRKHVYHQCFDLSDLSGSSEAGIIEIEEFLLKLDEKSVVAGTGIYRFEDRLPKGGRNFRTEVISARNFIRLFHHKSAEEHMKQTTAEELRSDYITTSQVNNTER